MFQQLISLHRGRDADILLRCQLSQRGDSIARPQSALIDQACDLIAVAHDGIDVRAGFRLASEGTEGENPDYLLFAKSTGR